MNLDTRTCSPDSTMILLLCCALGRPRAAAPRPLSPRDYSRICAWLGNRNLRLQDLPGAVEKIRHAPVPGVESSRLQALLARQRDLDGWLSWLERHGLWVLGREDPGFPHHLVERLGPLAPPLMHGCGNLDLLDQGGLAVVGSRDAEESKLAFSRKAAARCAEEGIQVISGAARGVDRSAMLGALVAGGSVVGVLPGNLHQAARSRLWREYLSSGRLALVTPFEPDTGFSKGTAMGRNRIIYLLGDWALVVDTAAGRGGTWAGAVQALNQRLVPVFVSMDGDASDGNCLLEKKGALVLTSDDLSQSHLAERFIEMVQKGIPDGLPRLF